MSSSDYPAEFLQRLRSITNKRAKVVIEHILEHGFVTTEELKSRYGYNHPPRAARDVREQGIPLETFSVKNAEGRTIAAYRFADPSRWRQRGGRRRLPKKLKQTLLEQGGSRCSICLTLFDPSVLQVDHRVPYELADDPEEPAKHPEEYMLLCGSCNRAKSWSCEHCLNWIELKDPSHCRSCYWGSPENYKHIALRAMRRLDIVWTEQEVEEYERIRERVQASQVPMPDYVKAVLRKHLEE